MAGGGGGCPWEKPKFFFAFQIGHIEIGKVMKFGVIWRPFWGSYSWFSVGGVLNTPLSLIGLIGCFRYFNESSKWSSKCLAIWDLQTPFFMERSCLKKCGYNHLPTIRVNHPNTSKKYHSQQNTKQHMGTRLSLLLESRIETELI